MPDADDSWFHALAGRTDERDAGSGVDGASLRSAILAQRALEDVDVATQDGAREEALIARARDAGLLARRTAPPRRRPLWLAAAAIACIAVGLTLQLRPTPAPVARGAPDGIAHLHAPDALRLKKQIIGELAAAGVAAKGYEAVGSQGIDADLPSPLPPAVSDILRRHGIAPPPDGVLQVEIEQTAPQ